MKKQIIAVAAAAMICVGAIGGTFAYLTSGPATVTNTFTVGAGVKFDESLNGGLDETKVNSLGVPVDAAGNALADPSDSSKFIKTNANTYKLIPGHNYKKDPTVHIATDSDDCYVFIKVENGIEDIEAGGDNTIASQIAEQWTSVPGKNGYYYWTEGSVSGGTHLQVFGEFTVDNTKTNGELEGYANAQIVIKACAVQADGFNSAADAVVAWPTGF